MADVRPRHFSLIRSFTLADMITIGNGGAGVAAILSVLNYLVSHKSFYLWLAFLLLPVAMVLDYLDGRIARWRRRASPLGAQLDSLADLISFGVAPAVLAFAVGMRGLWDAAVLIYFVSCGLSRLARYNVTAAELADETGKVKYFEGAPIPTSLLLVAVLAILTRTGRIHDAMLWGAVELPGGRLHPIVVLYLISGSAMISKTLHIPKI